MEPGERVREILKEALVSDEGLLLFRPEDLDALGSNGFMTVHAFRCADREVLKEVLPGRAALVGILLKAFVSPPADLKIVIERSIAEGLSTFTPVLKEGFSTFTPVLKEGFSTFTPVLDSIKALMLEHASATRAASRINKEDLRSLRSTLGILGPIPDVDGFSPDACVVDVEALLGTESDASETFWDERYEPQREADYIAELMNCIPPDAGRRFIWKSATKKTLKTTFKDGDFPVSASNDVVLCPKRYSSVFELGAILGVEIKKKLTWQGLHQAEVEFYLWTEESMFPYVQLITDMQRGGVAFYCKSGLMGTE